MFLNLLLPLIFTALPAPDGVAPYQASIPIPLPPGTPVVPAGIWHPASGSRPAPISSTTSASAHSGPDTLYLCDGIFSWYSTSNSISGSYTWSVTDEFRLHDRITQAWDQINGFSLNYCTDAVDPLGTGATLVISLYDQYTPCTPPSNPRCIYQLTGLPLSPGGNMSCWGLSVNLDGGFECAPGLDPPFLTEDAAGVSRFAGISLEFILPAGATGSIGPLVGGTNGYGNADQFWVDDPSGTSTGCRSWGGTPFSSFGLILFGPVAGTRKYFGNLPLSNPMTMWNLEPLQPVVAGSPATWGVGTGATGYFWLAASLLSGQRLITGWQGLEGIVLLGPPMLKVVPMNNGVITLNVPLSLAGSTVYVQAAQTNSGALVIADVIGCSEGLLHQL